MDAHAARLLEFSHVVAELQEYCFSPEGVELIGDQTPDTDPGAVGRHLRLVAAFRAELETREIPALDFPEVDQALRRLEKPGSALEAEQMAAIGRTIRSALMLRRYLAGGGKDDALWAIAELIPELDAVAQQIGRIINPDGTVREKDIPELRAISGHIRNLRAEVGRLAGSYLNDSSRRGYWQADRATQRQGRTVLPLKANFKGRIPGVIHESSASGATVYLEPSDIMAKNNEITLSEGEYQRELLRILRELTAAIRGHWGELLILVSQVACLDSIYARARYSRLHRCTPAEPTNGSIRLEQARHPMLAGAAIPIDVELSEGVRMMIITGPNTGGKTVSLKTVGLLAMMNQFGMEIPAEQGSRLPVFDKVLADIGDEQSIEQSLSTYSGHIRNLARIVEDSTESSLVLLDELGAGTDPEEGVAVAMAILDHFIDKGSVTLLTTHHGILKNYGYTRAGVTNASMEFDTRTLTPTYRIRLGVPGQSHALEIARAHGLPRKVMDRADAYLNDERGDISKLINHLTEKQHELLRTEESHKKRASELLELRRATDLRELRLRQKERELREAGVGDLRRFAEESRAELDRLIQEIREGQKNGTLPQQTTREATRFVQNLRERIDKEHEVIEEEKRREVRDVTQPGSLEVGGEVGIGVEVMLPSGQKARVIRRAKGDRWQVEAGSLKMTVSEQELRPVAPTPTAPVEVSSVSNSGPAAAFELDIRGFRAEDALAALQRQLDAALLQGMSEFGVIHGIGEGVLRKVVQDFLREQSAVKDFQFSHPEAGGFGKTIVRLG